jgi:hypothetical protein
VQEGNRLASPAGHAALYVIVEVEPTTGRATAIRRIMVDEAAVAALEKSAAVPP